MAEETNGNGYISKTRYKVAKIALGLIFLLAVTGIIIGLLIASLATIVGSAITAGITGIGGVAGVYIGGDSYRPSMPHYSEPSNTVVIQQGHGNDSQINDAGFPIMSEAPLPPQPTPFIEH